LVEVLEQRIEARIGIVVNCLTPRRVVHVSHGRNVTPYNVEAVDTFEFALFSCCDPSSVLFCEVDQQHVRAVAFEIEVLTDLLL